MSGLRPTALKNLEDRALRITWEDGRVDEFTYQYLRGACPCASCVDEWTGKRLIDPLKVDPSVKPVSVSFVGQYAIKFAWSDGHSTGIYTFQALRSWGSPVASDAPAKGTDTIEN